MVKNPDEEIGAQLQELGLSLGGSGRARAERLYRAWLRTVGIPDVPMIDVAGEELQTSHTELIMEEDDESGEPFESMIRTECIGITATQVTNGSILATRGLEAAPTLANLTMLTHTNTRTNLMSTVKGEAGVHHPTTETFVLTVTRPMMSTGATSRESYPGILRTSMGPFQTTHGAMNNAHIPNGLEHTRSSQHVSPTTTSVRGKDTFREISKASLQPPFGPTSYPIPRASLSRRDPAPKYDHYHAQPSLRHSSILENQDGRVRRTHGEKYVPHDGEYLLINFFRHKERVTEYSPRRR